MKTFLLRILLLPVACNARYLLVHGLAVSWAVQASPRSLEAGQMNLRFGKNEPLNLHGMHMILKKKKNSMSILMGGEDKQARAKIMIAVDLPEKVTLEHPKQFDTAHHNVYFVLKTPHIGATALPPMAPIEDAEIEYSTGPEATEIEASSKPNATLENQQKAYQKTHPKWRRFSREQKMQLGEGVQVNLDYTGTMLTIQLFPERISPGVQTFRGRISGIIKVQPSGESAMNMPIEAEFRVKIE